MLHAKFCTKIPYQITWNLQFLNIKALGTLVFMYTGLELLPQTLIAYIIICRCMVLMLTYSVLTLFRILPGKKFSWRRCFNCLDVKQVSYNYNEMYHLQLMPDGKLCVVAGLLLILFYVGSF